MLTITTITHLTNNASHGGYMFQTCQTHVRYVLVSLKKNGVVLLHDELFIHKINFIAILKPVFVLIFDFKLRREKTRSTTTRFIAPLPGSTTVVGIFQYAETNDNDTPMTMR